MSEFGKAMFLVVALLAGGCDGDGGGSGCVPGEARECPCDEYEYAGVQSCGADGETWSQCDCDSGVDTGTDTDPEPDTDTGWRAEPTAQRRCFDNAVEIDCPDLPCEPGGEFCGQDAQYPGNPRHFSCRNPDGTVQHPCSPEASEGETVVDSLTGLMWQRTWIADIDTSEGPTDKDCAWFLNQQAYGGYDDWRLPTCQELAGLIHHGRRSPAIDTVAFPGTPPVIFWSSDGAPGSNRYVVDFLDGSAGMTQWFPYTNASRCVRGEPYHVTFAGRYEVSGDAEDGVVRDRATGLTWSRAYASEVDWSGALSYCEGFQGGGYSGWRLPSVGELRTLMAVSQDAAVEFPEQTSYLICWGALWSSTSYSPNPGFAWGTPFQKMLKTSPLCARCVRGGP